MNLGSNIIGFVIMTFVAAIIYGLFATTMDFMHPNYNPVASGHRAADGVYGLFGTMGSEIKRNDPEVAEHRTSVAEKIAMPYAVVADLSAILGGKIELGMSSLFRTAEVKAAS